MKITFFGTGLMGEPMAHRLIDAGHELTVYNRTLSKTRALEARGAAVAGTPAQAMEQADVWIVMLADYPAMENVFLKHPLPNCHGKTIIQMSTIAVTESLDFKERVTGAGGEYLEAPVLGSIPQVKEGSLFILAGGSREQFERWEPLLTHLGDKRYYIGETGDAAAIKLAFNQLSASLTAAFSMSLGFIREKNIDIGQFMEILRQTAIYAPFYEGKFDNLIQRDFSRTNFPIQLLLKDVNLMLEEFQRAGIHTVPLEGVQKTISTAIANGDGQLDYSGLYQTIHPGKK